MPVFPGFLEIIRVVKYNININIMIGKKQSKLRYLIGTRKLH